MASTASKTDPIFFTNPSLRKKGWRAADGPEKNTFGFEHFVIRTTNSSDVIAFGFRSPGTLEKPTAGGCELEVERQKEDKTVKTVVLKKTIKQWDCLIETINSTGARQYYGIKKITKHSKQKNIEFEYFFASQGNMTEQDVRQVVEATTILPARAATK